VLCVNDFCKLRCNYVGTETVDSTTFVTVVTSADKAQVIIVLSVCVSF